MFEGKICVFNPGFLVRTREMGSDKNQGLKNRREIATVKAKRNLHNHRRRSLMQVQVSLKIELAATASLAQMEQ